MKAIITIAAFGIILSLTYCTESSSSQKFIPGYLSPGDFRPQGVPREKEYRLFTGELNAQTCGPGPQCIAVHTHWLTSESDVYSEGIAVNDRNVNPSVFSLKMYRAVGSPGWYVTIILDGASSTGIIDAGNVLITVSQSVDYSIPLYGTLTSSGVFLGIATITFNLVQPLTIGSVTFHNGDTIIAEEF
jgi:hypothetical protein